MAEREVSIPTDDGVCTATLHLPDGAGPWPAVIMYPDAFGVRPTFHEMAQRLADLGYAVLLPDVYYRSGPYAPFEPASAFADESERARLMAMMGAVTKQAAGRDAAAMLAFLAAQPEVADAPVGTTGYCMGGGLSLNAAGRHPARIGAAASFHGGNLATDADDSPHLLAGAITAKVLVAAAENDRSFDDAQAARLAAAFDDAGVDHQLVVYPALHGFAVPDMPVYDEAAAERHWHDLAELYATALH